MNPVIGYRPLWMELPVSMWPAYFEGERRLAQVKRHSRGTAGHAFSRLRITTHLDREACNDGKWVASRRRPDLWDVLIVGSELYLHGKRVESEADVARFFKPRYRWERRR
ncbi:hypothetical protein A7X60_01580 [Stenotrophomonas maltophilia]|nr:hypothetical protein A7X60_01580 [Stenotrophomonas maltophilia]